MYLTSCDGHFRNIYIFCVNNRKNSGDNVRTNRRNIQVADMPYYGALFNFDKFVHHTPVIFVSLEALFLILLESFVQKISDASRVLYIACLDSEYIHFLPRISRQIKSF